MLRLRLQHRLRVLFSPSLRPVHLPSHPGAARSPTTPATSIGTWTTVPRYSGTPGLSVVQLSEQHPLFSPTTARCLSAVRFLYNVASSPCQCLVSSTNDAETLQCLGLFHRRPGPHPPPPSLLLTPCHRLKRRITMITIQYWWVYRRRSHLGNLPTLHGRLALVRPQTDSGATSHVSKCLEPVI